MSNLTKTIDEKSDAMLQKAQNQMNEWREEIDELGAKLEDLSGEARAEYEKQLAKLKLHWQQVESKFSTWQQADDTRRGVAYADWHDTAVSYNEAFMQTASQMKKFVPLGWLQGFTDKRTQDSAGWAEGFGTRPAGSEGFAEGLGQKGKNSKGWAEGYDKASQS